MATVKFADISPYKQKKAGHHETDYKYSQYLQSVPSAGQKMQERSGPIHVALFGLGRAGSIHFSNLLTNFRMKLLYIVDIDTDRLNQFQEKFGLEDKVVVQLSNVEKIFDDNQLDCVIIATPTATHEGLVMQALNNGKSVMCEKPLSQEKGGIKRCYDLAKEKGLPLLCAFNREFDPAICNVRNQVHNGKVGQVQVIKTVSRDSGLPSIEYLSTSGGIYHDCAVHDIGLICWILGEYPKEVFAMAHTFIPEIAEIKDIDTTLITFKFPSGALGQIDLSRNAGYGYDQRLEVFGSKGMLVSANERPNHVSYVSGEGETFVPMYYSFASRYSEAYKQELNHFCDVMTGKADLSITAEKTLKISKIADALNESVRTGKVIHMEY